MRLLAGGGLASAFVCLLFAAALGDPGWRWALAGVMVGISVAACGAFGAVVARLVAAPRRWALAGIVAGVAAALTRQVLMGMIRARAADAPPQIRPLALLAATFTIVGGAFALLWGCAALRRLAAGPGGDGTRRTWPDLVLGGIAVSLGLYGISPVGQALGIKVSHWTFIGLAALALLAYGIEEGVVRLLRRSRRGARRGARPGGDRT
ncbi:MAG: hypothetical protein HY906_15035 [Deltaproteobacteria bacterium]|nr:hypothetical protein [Deltaproteobacteria bacterium]